MKKFLSRLALCLIPVILYLAVFIIFEPNNYFGIKNEAVSDDVIARLHEYRTSPAANVIIGESRFVKLDPELIEEISGKKFANLSFGGASLAEELDLLEWLLNEHAQTPETIILGASFYGFNEAYAQNRMLTKAMDNPFRYITNLTYNINMWEQVYIYFHNVFNPQNKIEHGGANETLDPANYVYIETKDPASGESLLMREDLIKYSLDGLSQRTDNWSLNQSLADKLVELNGLCNEKGTQLIVVFPPMDESVRRLVVNPGGIEPLMRNCITNLKQAGLTIIDYEFENPPNWSDDMFFDGFHLDEERGLPLFTLLLFEDIEKLKTQ